MPTTAVPSGDTAVRLILGVRYAQPIGPAPEGWARLPEWQCSRILPHTECAEPEQNAQMNADHYERRSP